MKVLLHFLLAISVLSAVPAMSQSKDSSITAIYTDFKSYWTSSTTSNNSVLPDSSHNLLAFKFRGNTYSTGANDATLTSKLGSSNYSAQLYKSLPIKNIDGTVISGGATNLAFALKNDGDSTKAAYKSPYPTIHIADVMTDGKNGLDLGTGVTNLPKGGHISFIINNLVAKAALDSVPDLLFTQIAEPTTSQPDTIYFADENGNVVGNKKLVYWNTVKKLGTYKLDLYTLTPGQSCNTAIMNGLFEQNGTRDIRMVAFLMTDFGITSTHEATLVKSLQINPSGSSDQAFIAYNANTVNIETAVITAQPTSQLLCTTTSTSATFSVSATGTNLTYRWKKNGEQINGATSSSYTINNLTPADTATAYTVTVYNAVSAVTSDNAYVKYAIVSQLDTIPTIATGNTIAFTGLKTCSDISFQWMKNAAAISNATNGTYSIPVVSTNDAGKYSVKLTYKGNTCTTNETTLKTSTILYAKASGNLNIASNWGVNTDGSGSSPVDFTRSEHTFVASNRATAATGADLSIAGTLDVNNANITITPGTTLTAGSIIRTYQASGVLSVFPTSNLAVGFGTSGTESSLYFDATNNTLKNLTIGAKAVSVLSQLNIAPGKDYGVVQVNYGTLYTSDLLTLKSDSLGTGSIGNSAGSIQGKVTIEKFIHARRAWRFIGAPVSATGAPTINAAWQEGATTSTANPAPGFGTHISGGTEANGFDISPTNVASIKYYSSGTNSWATLSNTNQTSIAQYPAYMIFVRGNRSYDISNTYYTMAPLTTVLRVKGTLLQGKQTVQTVTATGFTAVVNPYACPINFARLLSNGSNLKRRIYVWDPTLAGTNGVGAWVIVDGTTAGGSFRTTPPSTYVSTVLQAGQGFLVQSADGTSSGSLQMTEDLKDLSSGSINSDRVAGSSADTSLEVNLKLFNSDNTTSLADGVLFNFGANNNDTLDANDARKMFNSGENLGIRESGKTYSINSRTAPKTGDTLHLYTSNLKTASYQLQIVPSLVKNITFGLYDKYLNTVTPISATDTTVITFSVLSNVDSSKASDRFTIVTEKVSQPVIAVQPQLIFTSVKANVKSNTVGVEWNVKNESAVLYYQVQKSTDAVHFSTIASITGGNKGSYTYTDAATTTGTGYYRIVGVGRNGSIDGSSVISVQLANSTTMAAGISVYPNPLTGTAFTLTFNGMAAGAYTLSVVNSNGGTVFSKSINHNGGTASQKVSLNSHLAPGVYYIKTVSAEGAVTTTKVSAY